ncbi:MULTISPECIES: CoA-transferase [unclassified Aerococcus]|uniref:CoA-transferase n=1 Tax=unclassified Aerococcus TaxID=2618060 RepID=UPI0025C43857|nr:MULTISPECIES: CoA-transferase [unclassified Aerococcus]
MKSKVRSVTEIVTLVKDEARIAFTTSGIGGLAEEFFGALRYQYEQTSHPKDITVISVAGLSRGEGTGIDLLLAPGLLKRYIGSHIHGAPLTGQAALDNQIELFIIPQGTIGLLYRNAAEKGPGVWTKVGIDTYVDPRQSGGKMSDKARQQEDLMTVETLQGEEWLFYKNIGIDVAVIKATYADEKGNLAFTHEPMNLQALTMAIAAKNSGGIVIAQVEQVVKKDSLQAKSVLVPGILVDYVYKGTAEYHQQTFATSYNPLLSNEIRSHHLPIKPGPLSPKLVIARRAALELKQDSIINIGVGLPCMVSNLFYEAHLLDQYHFTTDLGAVGGVPAPGFDYGPNYNAEAVINSGDMFDLYHGGGLETTILGFGEINQNGNVNTTLLGNRIMGPGGMMDIAEGAKQIIFVGPFMVKDKSHIENNQLVIDDQGSKSKFTDPLSYITFNGLNAVKAGKKITIVTDRAVFELDKEAKLVLTELAPGLDLQKDILDQMGFSPVVADDLKVMDSHLFAEAWSLKNGQVQ